MNSYTVRLEVFKAIEINDIQADTSTEAIKTAREIYQSDPQSWQDAADVTQLQDIYVIGIGKAEPENTWMKSSDLDR